MAEAGHVDTGQLVFSRGAPHFLLERRHYRSEAGQLAQLGIAALVRVATEKLAECQPLLFERRQHGGLGDEQGGVSWRCCGSWRLGDGSAARARRSRWGRGSRKSARG